MVGPLLALVLLLAAAGWAVPAQAAVANCLSCHGDEIHAEASATSVHRDLSCTACHVPDPAAAADQHPAGCPSNFRPPNCARCHAEEARAHQGSAHDGQRLPVTCWQCHQEIHSLKPMAGDRLASARLCVGCHENQESFFSSAHGAGLAKGNAASPGCVDCHSVHAVAAVDNDGPGRSFHTSACIACHADSARMVPSGVEVLAVETFLHSFHGKNVRLGHAKSVAGCADCHGSHGVWPADDPRSTVHADSRVETCRQCHVSAGTSFARWMPHGDDRDPQASPALYWTRVSMTTLLVGTFLFFWLHSLLWAFRSFVERQRACATAGTPAHAAAPGPRRVFRRFSTLQIVLHLVVVASFLGLALTGLPLKFSGTGWGRFLMDLLGGTERARLIHHSAAVVTFGYFLTALVLSARFLFPRGPVRGGVGQRLFGPDSLFPNLRDWTDFRAMLRWFFFQGPKPTFERWTYWEKFDFMAVFWGMLAIGGSGLLLWFPEFFARFVPGWLFNVATIVHSDEALLATGFIFTVHFFNTHFRPEKFPMDTVIFNGRVSEEEMREERGDQLRRYEAEGRTEAFLTQEPLSLPWEFSFRILGLLAVAVGLALALLMTWTLLSGGL